MVLNILRLIICLVYNLCEEGTTILATRGNTCVFDILKLQKMTYMNMRIDKLNFILLFDKLFDQKPKNKRVMTFFGHVFCPLKLVAVHGFRLDLDLAFQ